MAEKFLHIWKLQPPMRFERSNFEGARMRIVKSTEVMIAAQAKPAVDFAVLVFSGSGYRCLSKARSRARPV
jgi:hypothetical protein